jgi:molybdopterin molybdotransferase
MHAAGGEVVLRKAAIQPGKPITVARCGERMILALPGNPVSALACVHVFGWPIVRGMLGLEEALPWREVELGTEVKPNPHREVFRFGRIEHGRIVVPSWHGSGDMVHTAAATGLVRLPRADLSCPPGPTLPFLPLA